MKKLLLTIFVALLMPSVVSAQTEPTLALGSGKTSLNASNCETSLTQPITVSAQHTDTSSDNHILKFVYFTDSTECLSNLDSCPSHFIDSSEACGCLAQHTVTGSSPAVDTSITLADIEGLTEFLCSDNSSLSVSVSVQLDLEGTEPVYTQSPINIVVDVVAPDTPSTAPTLGSGERSLTVTISEGNADDDVTSHEVCVAPRGSIEPPADCSIDDEQNAEERLTRLYCGFAESDCSQTNELIAGDSKYRIEGLLNDVEYEVVVAAMDAAGNRSGNSPSSYASPAEFTDFAEGYSDLFSDGQMGETGGCTTDKSLNLKFISLFLLALAMRRNK